MAAGGVEELNADERAEMEEALLELDVFDQLRREAARNAR